jgi:hypothetical protein
MTANMAFRCRAVANRGEIRKSNLTPDFNEMDKLTKMQLFAYDFPLRATL